MIIGGTSCVEFLKRRGCIFLVLNCNNAVERKKLSCHSCVGQDRSIAAAIKQDQGGVLKETGKRKHQQDKQKSTE
jgi:hypothetical protein